MDDNHCISKQHFHLTFYTFKHCGGEKAESIMLIPHTRCVVVIEIQASGFWIYKTQ